MSDEGRRLALARDEFFESLMGSSTIEGIAHGVYLRNRLEYAFVSGWEAGRKDATPPPQPSASEGSVPEMAVSMCSSSQYAKGWNDCRAAMLAAPQPTTKKG
jgi:hypothetical protein